MDGLFLYRRAFRARIENLRTVMFGTEARGHIRPTSQRSTGGHGKPRRACPIPDHFVRGFPQPRARCAPCNVPCGKPSASLRVSHTPPALRWGGYNFRIPVIFGMDVPSETCMRTGSRQSPPVIRPFQHRLSAARIGGRRGPTRRSALPFRDHAPGSAPPLGRYSRKGPCVVPARPFGPGRASSSARISPTVAAL